MRASVNNTVPNLLSIPYYCYHFARETIIIETHLWHPLSLHGVERGRTFFCRMGYRYVSHRSAHIYCRRVLQCLDCKSRAVHNVCFCNWDRLRSIAPFREATLVAKYTCKLAAPARISRSSLRKKRSFQGIPGYSKRTPRFKRWSL